MLSVSFPVMTKNKKKVLIVKYISVHGLSSGLVNRYPILPRMAYNHTSALDTWEPVSLTYKIDFKKKDQLICKYIIKKYDVVLRKPKLLYRIK